MSLRLTVETPLECNCFPLFTVGTPLERNCLPHFTVGIPLEHCWNVTTFPLPSQSLECAGNCCVPLTVGQVFCTARVERGSLHVPPSLPPSLPARWRLMEELRKVNRQLRDDPENEKLNDRLQEVILFVAFAPTYIQKHFLFLLYDEMQCGV